MNLRCILFAFLIGTVAVLHAPAGEPKLPLRVLYIGDDKSRSADYAALLGRHFTEVHAVRRTGFKPSDAKDADVVLLDWSQAETPVRKAVSPFGKPDEWGKPTVLLGSAGLLLAGQWQIIGGAG
jgi:hypothetical protein